MMNKHADGHKWRLYEQSTDGAFCIAHRACKMGRNKAEDILNERAKLLQAVNDKDQELFESQELIGEMLEACQNALGIYDALKTFGADKALPGYESCLAFLNEAIRKAKEK